MASRILVANASRSFSSSVMVVGAACSDIDRSPFPKLQQPTELGCLLSMGTSTWLDTSARVLRAAQIVEHCSGVAPEKFEATLHRDVDACRTATERRRRRARQTLFGHIGAHRRSGVAESAAHPCIERTSRTRSKPACQTRLYQSSARPPELSSVGASGHSDDPACHCGVPWGLGVHQIRAGAGAWPCQQSTRR